MTVIISSTLFLFSFISVLVGLVILITNKNHPGILISLAIISSAISIFANGMEVLSPQLEEKYFWLVIYYISLAIFPPASFAFIATWMRLSDNFKNRLTIFISIIPVIAALLMIFFPANHLVFDKIWLDTSGIVPVLKKTVGSFYWVNQGFSLLYLLGLIISIAYRYRHEQGLARGQANLLIGGLFIPLISTLLFHLGFRLLGVLNPVPFSFLPSILLIWYAVLRFKLVTIQTIARAQVLEQLQEGILVINRQGILIDINPAAQVFLGRPEQNLLGKSLEGVSTQLARHLKGGMENLANENTLILCHRPIQVSVSPLIISHAEYAGDVVIMRNISAQIEVERLKEMEVQRLAAWVERKKIARTLHDSIKQYLNCLVILSSSANQRLQQRKYAQLTPIIENITISAHRASEEMQLFILELQLAGPSDNGFHLINALTERINSIRVLSTLQINFQSPSEIRLTSAQQHEVFYILLEALNNILQHANAISASLIIQTDGDDFIADICDDGNGFNSEQPVHTGMGLANMRERAVNLHGNLSLTSRPGSGTKVHLIIPGAITQGGKGEPA